MKITPVKTSRRDQIDFDQLTFGQIFTDHMFICDFKDGAWQTPEIVPYGPISIAPSMSALHYGQAVFEGMKAYKDTAGGVWLFRPDENFNRINRSSERLSIPAFPKEYFFEGLNALLKLDQNWIPSDAGSSLYVRPFVFANTAGIQASPAKEYRFMIICSPVKAYYSGAMRVKVEEKFSRAAPGGVGYAKAAGNYAAQFYPTGLAQKEDYQQVIWTDASAHQNLEESGTMNVFVRLNDELITAPTSDSILDGVTRKSILQIAKDKGIAVVVRPIAIAELVEGHASGALKEVFGCGTAVLISPFEGLGFQNNYYPIEAPTDSFAQMLKETLVGIQYNTLEDPYNWRYKVL